MGRAFFCACEMEGIFEKKISQKSFRKKFRKRIPVEKLQKKNSKNISEKNFEKKF